MGILTIICLLILIVEIKIFCTVHNAIDKIFKKL
jgi:hypothetical protein